MKTLIANCSSYKKYRSYGHGPISAWILSWSLPQMILWPMLIGAVIGWFVC